MRSSVCLPGVAGGDGVGTGRPQLSELPLGIVPDLLEHARQFLADPGHVFRYAFRVYDLVNSGPGSFAGGRVPPGDVVEVFDKTFASRGLKSSVLAMMVAPCGGCEDGHHVVDLRE